MAQLYKAYRHRVKTVIQLLGTLRFVTVLHWLRQSTSASSRPNAWTDTATRGWTRENSVNWLHDLLPYDLFNEFMIIWGYNANIYSSLQVSCQYFYDQENLRSTWCRYTWHIRSYLGTHATARSGYLASCFSFTTWYFYFCVSTCDTSGTLNWAVKDPRARLEQAVSTHYYHYYSLAWFHLHCMLILGIFCHNYSKYGSYPILKRLTISRVSC